MNTIKNQGLMVRSRPTQLLTQIGPETRQILDLAEQKGWDLNILGQADLPTEPVHLDQWLIVPASQDSSEIPNRTFSRIQALYANGIRPKGFVVVHEAPRLLCAPKKIEQQGQLQEGLPQEAEKPRNVTGISNLVVSIASAILRGTYLTIFGALFLGLAVIDPIVVAVMEDGCWVEIDRWEIKV